MVVANLPTTALHNCSNGFMICLATWASDITTGLFWMISLLAFCVIIFMATMRLGATRAFGFASFVGMIGGVFLSILKLTPWWMGSTFIIIGVIGLAILVISEKG